MTTRTITDGERWENFKIASNQYFLTFSPKGQIYFNESIQSASEDHLIETIAYLTSEQKKEAIKDLGYILLHCKHNKEKFKSLIEKSLVSSEEMECIEFIPSSKKTYEVENNIDSLIIDGNPEGTALIRDLNNSERKLYKVRYSK